MCCIDVECVATGTTHHDRAISQIALVDYGGHVLCDLFVVPSQPVVSYITPLTGCDEVTLRERGTSLEVRLSPHAPFGLQFAGVTSVLLPRK